MTTPATPEEIAAQHAKRRRRRRWLVFAATGIATFIVAAVVVAALGSADGLAPAAIQSPNTAPITPSPGDVIGQKACDELRTGASFEIFQWDKEWDEPEVVNDWVQSLYDNAHNAQNARSEHIQKAASVIVDRVESDPNGDLAKLVGDLIALPEPPLMSFVTACNQAGLMTDSQLRQLISQATEN